MKNKTKLLPHQERVEIELIELTIKRDGLLNFFDTKIFKELEDEDRTLLLVQLQTMDQYILILTSRIDRFYKLNSQVKENLPKVLFSRDDIKQAYDNWLNDWKENPSNYDTPITENDTVEMYYETMLKYLQ